MSKRTLEEFVKDYNETKRVLRPNPDWEEDLRQTVVITPEIEERVRSYSQVKKKKVVVKECHCQDGETRPGVAPLIKLNDGNSMPSFGLGTWLGLDKSGNLATVQDDSIQKAVEIAIDAGYRHIDTAAVYNTEEQITEEDYICEACRDLAMYAVNQCLQQEVSGTGDQYAGSSHRGHTHVCLLCGCSLLRRQSDKIIRNTPNDLQRSIITIIENRLAPRQVGIAIKNKIAENVVQREDLFITSKLWNDRHKQADVLPALRESLAKLDLEYLDLYLIHFPIAQYNNGTYYEADFLDTWKGMVEARGRGLVRSVGVSNFNLTQLRRLLASTGLKPAALQIEVNLNLQQAELIAFCKTHDIAIIGYTPFGSLFHNKAKKGAPPPRTDEQALLRIADKYHKTVAQVALRYIIELGVIPIPKSVTKKRIEQNIEVFDFRLTQQERDTMKRYDNGYRVISVDTWKDSPDYPFEKKSERKK